MVIESSDCKSNAPTPLTLMKCFVWSGDPLTDPEDRKFFRCRKTSSHSSAQENGTLELVSSVRGAAIAEKLGQNHLQIPAIPKNCITYFWAAGVGKLIMPPLCLFWPGLALSYKTA